MLLQRNRAMQRVFLLCQGLFSYYVLLVPKGQGHYSTRQTWSSAAVIYCI